MSHAHARRQVLLDRCRVLVDVAQPLLEAGLLVAVKACGWPKPDARLPSTAEATAASPSSSSPADAAAAAVGTLFAMLLAVQV